MTHTLIDKIGCKTGDVTRITALMLLVPPAAALQAWLLFGQKLTAWQLAGFMVTLAGVALVQGVRLSPKSRAVH